MYALWIQSYETSCILQNDNNFFNLLQSKFIEHINRNECLPQMPNDTIIRFVQSCICLEDLLLITESFSPLCRFTWSILEVELP